MILIEAGHSPKKPGAKYKHDGVTYYEHKIVINQRKCLKQILKKIAPGIEVITDGDSETLSETIKKFKSAKNTEKDVVISLHVNSAHPEATGLEIFVPERATAFENEYAQKMCADFSKAMGIRNRGVKPESLSQHKSLAVMTPKGANFLIEWFFLPNKSDLMAYIREEDYLMLRLAEIAAEMHEALQNAK